jgi:hypothetical protein
LLRYVPRSSRVTARFLSPVPHLSFTTTLLNILNTPQPICIHPPSFFPHHNPNFHKHNRLSLTATASPPPDMPQANESYRTHREYQRSRSRSPRPRSVQRFERRRSYRPRTVRHHDRSRRFSSSGLGAEAGDRFGEREEGGSWHRGPRHRRSSRDRASRHESTAGERPSPYGGVETWANEVPTHLSSIPVQSTKEEHDATHVSKEATKPTLMTGDLRKHFKSGDVIGERYGGFVFGSFGVPEFNTTSAGPTSANHSVLCIVRDVYENHLTCWARQLKGLDGVKAENHGAHLGLGRAGDNDWGCESPHEQLKMTPIAGAGHFERSTHFSARYLEDVWPTVRCFAYGRLEDRSLMRLSDMSTIRSVSLQPLA